MKFKSDVVIGIECHIELDTSTKLFCGCSRKPIEGEEPNTRTCEVCLGLPGSKPVLNKKAVDYALKLCTALKCKISPELIFSRKSYFYPDMAKNYQISQFEIPLGTKGILKLKDKDIGITRVHMEEDPASMLHQGTIQTSPFVLVDYNRSGDPLCEIVTEPDMESPEQAREFMKKLITILNYLGVFKQGECIIKADVNVSIKDSGYVRSEIKNVTGFKEIQRAIEYEVERQKKVVKEGGKLVMDTRAWDAGNGITTRLRTKETEADYGYILDPDLTITEITKQWVDKIKKEMPELAEDKIKKYIKNLKISEIDAEVIAAEKELAELFEKVAEMIDPVLAARWLRRELVRVMNYNEKTFAEIEVDEKHLTELLEMVGKKQITDNVAKKILEMLMEKPFSPKEYVKKEGLEAVSDTAELEKLAKEVIEKNPEAVEDFKKGNQKSLNFLVGQIMRQTKGKASPQEVSLIIKKLIG